MELIWLEDFAALAKTENFSRAAEKRHVTQPAFSRRIRSFEEWLGAQLFSRGGHKVMLTKAGKEIHPEVEMLIRTMYRVRRMAQESEEHKAAVLYFAATHSLSLAFFPAWIKKYATVTNRYAINLISDTMAACEEALLQGRVHFLLCHESPTVASRFTAKGFSSLTVGVDTLSPYAPADSTGKPLWDLTGASGIQAPWMQYSPESAFHRMMGRHPKVMEYMAASSPSFTARLATVLLSVACDGKGLAWLPASLAEPAVAEGRIVRTGNAEWDIPMDVCLFYSEDGRSEGSVLLWQAISKNSI